MEKITLASIHQKYEQILKSNLNNHRKSVKYAKLMTKMEKEFDIPLLQDDEWEKNNKEIISLYRKISMSRK